MTIPEHVRDRKACEFRYTRTAAGPLPMSRGQRIAAGVLAAPGAAVSADRRSVVLRGGPLGYRRTSFRTPEGLAAFLEGLARGR